MTVFIYGYFPQKKTTLPSLMNFPAARSARSCSLRLAISRALVEAGQQGKQFIILDEPFAFFDRERIRNTITSLNGMDKNITQFWIITQEFESPEQFELNIQCSRDSDELKVEGKRIAGQREVVSDVV